MTAGLCARFYATPFAKYVVLSQAVQLRPAENKSQMRSTAAAVGSFTRLTLVFLCNSMSSVDH